ncbi:MAG: hypothetical protein AAGH60_15230 [Pseudomonadota bacterium]
MNSALSANTIRRKQSSASLSSVWRGRIKAPLRVFLAVFLSYAAVASMAAAFGLSMAAVGWMAKAPALMWAMLLGFPAYFGLFLWAFVERRVWRVWFILVGVTALSVVGVVLLGGDPAFGVA